MEVSTINMGSKGLEFESVEDSTILDKFLNTKPFVASNDILEFPYSIRVNDFNVTESTPFDLPKKMIVETSIKDVNTKSPLHSMIQLSLQDLIKVKTADFNIVDTLKVDIKNLSGQNVYLTTRLIGADKGQYPVCTEVYYFGDPDSMYKKIPQIQTNNIANVPANFLLYQNFPNPFNPETIIKFELPHNSFVRLEIYNIMGQKIKTLICEQITAGVHSINWDGQDDFGRNVSSGIYLYRIHTEGFAQTKKMFLLR